MKTRTVLYADEGMVLTDGTIYGKQLFLADGADGSTFREITDAAYEAAMQAEAEPDVMV